MARASVQQPRSRRPIIAATSVVAIVGLVATVAVFSDGYDSQETPRLDASVWVTRDDGQYARVNTDLGEIDTVRSVDDPSSVLQLGSDAFVLTQNDRLLWPVDPGNPLDLNAGGQSNAGTSGEQSPDAETDAEAVDDSTTSAPQSGLNTPPGTRTIASAGSYVAFLTDLNKVFLGRLPEGGASSGTVPTVTRPVDPYAGMFEEDDPDALIYQATSVAVSPSGMLVMYSDEDSQVLRFDATTGEFVGDPIDVVSPPADVAGLELTLVGDAWVLSQPSESLIWLEGKDPISTGLGGGALLQSGADDSERVYLADGDALVAVTLDDGEVSEVAAGSGEPARPVIVDGVVYAAWIGPAGGELWSSATSDTITLEVADDVLDEVRTISPVFRSNGMRAVLSEQSSGLLWTVPGGQLIPLEQWTIDDSELEAGEVQIDDVAEQEPPVAVADSFGVRAGGFVRLPLLLNDHDPNKKDVLSIDRDSLSSLADSSFGELGLISNNQEAVIRVRAGSGSTTFSYSVTDGYAVSTPVTVTLTVVGDDSNSAPVWCGVSECVQEWPSPQIAPGGTITVPVLSGWVDPEGDPVVLTDARKESADDPVTVVPTYDGSVAIRHQDPNAAGGTIPITVSVSDSRGANSTRTLLLVVTGSPSLTVAPVALAAGVDEKVTVTVAEHVFGGSGTYRLIDAATADEGLLVVPNAAAGSIDLTAGTTGEFSLTYTVQDVSTLAEQTAVIRVSVVGNAPLAMAPITTFVRANEDTTVDVLGAVQNTTGRVLLVSSITTGDPALSVSVVGQSSVRVSGSTPDGVPGRIGTAIVTVTDGAGAYVEGTLTVFLAPPSTGVGAIAVPDTVTVRAGSQVDIPVTANDVSPRGERLQVLPTLEGSGADGELAFVSGDTVRYLAPKKEGTYVLRYSVYLGTEPSRLDTATITVTVVPPGTNRAPQPPILDARVLSGETVQIPVNGFGMDPDGDAVVLAEVSQPKAGHGVASISADGASIIYSASGSGINGSQVRFAYTVRDSEGAEAEGAVRVGVLDADISDSAPVTYSDYVAAQLGSTDPVTVVPLLNDSDPAGGTLELVSLVPNTPAVDSNPEYARLEALIGSGTSLESGTVQLSAGDVLGTHSYIYTVQSSETSSTAEGLIVVSVVDEGSLDYPIVTDTVVTAKNRNQLAQGIDVVSGKVHWQTGDISSLTLSLWGSAPAGFRASGSSISGELPRNGVVVPFTLTGEDAAGNPVVSYGFLRVPALNDMRLQLKPNLETIEVGEEKSVTFDLRDVLDLNSSDRIAMRDQDSFVVQRANSTCVAAGSTAATYTAGREAPWLDYCAVPVRLDGQDSWTTLAVPISIAPKDPLAQLSGVTRTIAPGSTDVVDMLKDMTSWQGGRVGDISLLDYTTLFSGSSFIVTQSADNTITIDARADAVPGTRENIQVSVSSFGGLSNKVTLVVGIAAPDTPRGATFTQQCDVRTGSTCSITVIGQPGEYDPFAGKVGSGLELASIGTGGATTCAVASIAMSGTTRITATYPAGEKPAGGECIVPYTVTDAQGRIGAGQLTIDILGFPQPPASLTTVGYSATSVSLSVALGEASNAHPSVTRVGIYLQDGTPQPATCDLVNSATYVCVVSGLVNGENHTYTARAVNSIGDSANTTALTTNAYKPPVVTSLAALSVFQNGLTTVSNARVQLTIASDDDTLSFKVTTNTTQTIPRSGNPTVVTIDAPAGSTNVSVVPVSLYSPPINNGSAADGGAVNAMPAPTGAAIGAPQFTGVPTAVVSSKTRFTVSIPNNQFDRNHAPSGSLTYLAWQDGQAAGTCGSDAGGGMTPAAAYVSASGVFDVSVSYVNYRFMVCGTNSFGVASAQGADAVYAGVRPGTPPTGVTYAVNEAGAGGPTVYNYTQNGQPTVTAPADFTTYFYVGGIKSTTLTLRADVNTRPEVRFCAIADPNFCSDPSYIEPEGALTIATVTFPLCYSASQDSKNYVTGGMRSEANFTVTENDDLFRFDLNWSGNVLESISSEWLELCE